MIKINYDKCNVCGLCVKICHESCIDLINDKIQINHKFCSTCTQCIAVCPRLALSWDNHEPIPFDNRMLPVSSQLDELFKQRRTNRFFKKRKPERQVLEEIISHAVYAPTHNFNFRIIVVDEDKLLAEIDNVVFQYNIKIYKYLYKPKIIRFLIRFLAPSQEGEYLQAKPKLESSLEIGRAYLSMPPALIMIIGDRRTPLSIESAQYAIYNMDLFAMTKGLGCRNLVGNQMFLNRSKKLLKILGLSKNEKIYATMGIGYPGIKFRNKVIGKKMNIQWINVKPKNHK
jgi:nitroreductase/NAD-dependent dihydropyrimidine dehydrogenase PreA subunit